MIKLTDLKGKDLKRVTQVLETWADTFSNRYKEKLAAVRSSGQLENSIAMQVNLNGNEWEVSVRLPDYWRYIEEGRQPGTFPPVQAMIEYIGAKPIVPQPYTLADGKQVVPTENQLAFLIGRSIKEKGREAKPLMEQTMAELKQGLAADLTVAFAEDLSEHIDILFTNL